MLENKADVNKVNEDGETPLYRAASGGFLGIVDKMLAEYGGDPNKGSPDKRPLVAACLMQNVALVDTLLKHGGDPNLTWTSFDVDSKGVTKCPLLVAICNGNSDIVTKGAISSSW